MTSEMLIKPFDPTLPTQVLTDASRLHGLGYLLLQHKTEGGKTKVRVVQCGSFALTPAQHNYAVIELEFLAIVRAIQKCDFYLRGMQSFEVITGHKPLIGIMGKAIGNLQNRLSRLWQKVAQYNFNVKWVAGKIHHAADAMSRYPVFEA